MKHPDIIMTNNFSSPEFLYYVLHQRPPTPRPQTALVPDLKS